MNELGSVRWTRFADAMTRLAGALPKELEEIRAELRVRTEVEQERNRLLREQNALLMKLVTEVGGMK